MAIPSIKIEKRCADCGSDEITANADATWNGDLQDWELRGVYDDEDPLHCDECWAQFYRDEGDKVI